MTFNSCLNHAISPITHWLHFLKTGVDALSSFRGRWSLFYNYCVPSMHYPSCGYRLRLL